MHVHGNLFVITMEQHVPDHLVPGPVFLFLKDYKINVTGCNHIDRCCSFSIVVPVSLAILWKVSLQKAVISPATGDVWLDPMASRVLLSWVEEIVDLP